MRAAWLVAASALAACEWGDNAYPAGPALVPSSDLAIVAHADDDLLFMQPDLSEAVRRGTGVTNVYVTAGNGRGGLDDAEDRERGLLRAYGALAGSDAWFCGTLALAGHTALHCRLDDAHVSLVFLGYPDGGKQGEYADSLARLWDGTIASATTVARHPTRYARAGLIAAVAAVIDATEPSTIRTLDGAATHGRDHADHLVTGALAVVATAASQVNPRLLAYRGYNTADEPVNVIEPLAARSAEILAVYHGGPIPAVHDLWLHRRYAVAMRPAAAGLLRAGGQCAALDHAGALALVDCAAAPTWQLAPDGTLRAGDRCVTLVGGEPVATARCAPDAAGRFFLDDEGHLFLGTAPELDASAGTLAYLRCLAIADGRPRAVTCGGDAAPVWELSPAPTETARPAGLTRSGRAVRLADVDRDGRADLCAIEAGQLACATGDGAGGFGAMTPLGALAVEPDSLVIGDVDGDGAPDACGRDAGGITCALAATGFVAARWTTAFATGGPATARSLAAADANGDLAAEICGLADDGIVCAYPGLAALPSVRSAWPARDATVWPGDLDGDGLADWCATSPAGIACGLDLHRSLTTDGVPWSFARGGVLDAGPTDAATGALADIDGDGRADLCTLVGHEIRCARSQDHGFGPPVTLGSVGGGIAPTALWLGDLDGDGAADACTDDGLAIRCLRAR